MRDCLIGPPFAKDGSLTHEIVPRHQGYIVEIVFPFGTVVHSVTTTVNGVIIPWPRIPLDVGDVLVITTDTPTKSLCCRYWVLEPTNVCEQDMWQQVMQMRKGLIDDAR